MLDPLTIAIIFLAGLVAIGLAAFVLNRAWGDFPTRLRLPDGTPERSPSPAPGWETAPTHPGEADAPELEEHTPLPAGAPEDELIPVNHPLVKRAVAQALERGGTPYATYFVRHGEQIYLAAYRIADPEQRAQLTRLFLSLNRGELEGIDLGSLIRAVQQLGR